METAGDKLEEDPEFNKLRDEFVAIFYVPALMTLEGPPFTTSCQDQEKTSRVGYFKLRKSRAANAAKISSIRDAQKLLVDSQVASEGLGKVLINAKSSIFEPHQSSWYLRNYATGVPEPTESEETSAVESQESGASSSLPSTSTRISTQSQESAPNVTKKPRQRRIPTPTNSPRVSSRLATKRDGNC